MGVAEALFRRLMEKVLNVWELFSGTDVGNVVTAGEIAAMADDPVERIQDFGLIRANTLKMTI